MTYIKEYWLKKEERANQAVVHTKEMQDKYGKSNILKSIENTKIYDVDFVCNKNITKEKTEIFIEDLDTVSAAKKYINNDKLAVLNFASYKNPGGMFIIGSKAQEECLCHSSYLYNVLLEFTNTFYKWNNQHKNKSLYLNRCLYSPNIIFECDDTIFECDVITCAAPNKSAAQEYQKVTDKENTEVLISRIKYVLDIAKDNNIDTLILGAYGCGVFGQDPIEVAEIFKKHLETTHKNCFKKVIFAIPNGKNNNLKSFKKVINN